MPKTQVLFIHVPKCGGQTVYGILDRMFSWQDVMTVWDYEEREYEQWVTPHEFQLLEISEILKYQCIRGHISFDQVRRKLGTNLRQFFVCTLVRDPVDQVVSRWNYIRQHPEHRQHQLVMGIPFDHWVTRSTDNQQCRCICGKTDARTALQVIDTEYDLVEPLERFDAFVHALCESLGRSVRQYQRRNVSRKAISRRDLTPEIVDLIRRKNDQDCLLYAHIARDGDRSPRIGLG